MGYRTQGQNLHYMIEICRPDNLRPGPAFSQVAPENQGAHLKHPNLDLGLKWCRFDKNIFNLARARTHTQSPSILLLS